MKQKPDAVMKKMVVLFVLLIWKCHGQPFDGFYAGINGGGKIATSEGSMKSSLGYYDLFPNKVTYTFEEPSNAHQQRFYGSVFAGYGITFCAVFAGIETFINFPKHELVRRRAFAYHLNFGEEEGDFVRIKQNFNQTLSATSRIIEYGIDFKSGFLVGDYTLFYGRAGIGFNRFNVKSNTGVIYEDTSRGFVPPPELPSVSSAEPFFVHRYKQVTALRLGVGFEQLLTQNCSITLDYIYTYYGDVALSGRKDTAIRDRIFADGLRINFDGRLSSNAVVFGVCTRFCLSSLTRYYW